MRGLVEGFQIILGDKKTLFIIYLVLIFLATPSGIAWYFKVSFWLFSLFLVWVIGIDGKFKIQNSKFKINDLWFLLPLGILIITRLMPFLRFGEAPLGYDTGIYLKEFEDSFFKVRETGLLGNGNPGLYIANILMFLGWSGGQLISVFYIILGIFVGLGIYIVSKEYFGKGAAFFSFLIFALSLSQFLAYRWFFWRMMAAIILTLAAFYLLKRKSWLIIPVAGFMGAIHLLSLLPFGLAMVLSFIFNKERKFLLLSGLGILAVAASLSWREFLGYLPFYTEKFGLIKDYPAYQAQELAGQFVNFGLYRGLVLIYLPFAILSFIRLIKKRNFSILCFYFLVNFIIIYSNLVFHNRFIILLDIIAVILASSSVHLFIGNFWKSQMGKIGIVLLLLAGIFGSFYQGLRTKALVGREELSEIKSLSWETEPNAYVMVVSSYYSPWVYGYSGRRTIAPGLFEHDKWDFSEWQTFWAAEDRNTRHKLLDEYEKPLYVFVGDKTKWMEAKLKDDPAFVRTGKRIWKYIGPQTSYQL